LDIEYQVECMLSANAFVNRAEKPADDEVAAALGAAKALWDGLLRELADEFGLVATEWYCYSRKAGWSLRVKQKERSIVYLSPGKGAFFAAFALGDKAVAAARASKLPQRAVKFIDEARKYAEGTAVRIVVKRPADISVVKKLVAAKLQN
jgi:hypothetical protein